jgi:hypothetical protein
MQNGAGDCAPCQPNPISNFYFPVFAFPSCGPKVHAPAPKLHGDFEFQLSSFCLLLFHCMAQKCNNMSRHGIGAAMALC